MIMEWKGNKEVSSEDLVCWNCGLPTSGKVNYHGYTLEMEIHPYAQNKKIKGT